MRNLCVVGLGVLVACGGNSNSGADAPVGHDAPIGIDAPKPDAPKPIDGPLAADATPVTGAHHHYVVSSETIPTSSSQATENWLDLNDDGTVDNQFGSVLAALSAQGVDAQTPTTTAITHGTILQLADVQGDALTSGTAGFTLFAGADPDPAACASAQDTTCGHQLSGSASFTIAAGSPDDPELAGTITGGVLLTGPGQLGLQVALFGTPITTLDLVGARAKLSATADGITSGIVGGGITTSDVNTKIYPGIATELQAGVAADCTMLASPPTCGCASGSTGATALSLFDGDVSGTTKDCHISTAEVAGNTLIQSLFAPDLTVGGQQVLSFGIGFTAVDATFTQP